MIIDYVEARRMVSKDSKRQCRVPSLVLHISHIDSRSILNEEVKQLSVVVAIDTAENKLSVFPCILEQGAWLN